MRPDDRVFRVAVQVHRRLSRNASERSVSFNHRVSDLLTYQSILNRLLRRITLAQQRGWFLAADRLRIDLPSAVRSVTASGADLIRSDAPHLDPAPPLQLIVDELRQLQSEFEHVDLSQRGKIVAHTEPIELEGIHLGRFAIELKLGRLTDHSGNSCFDCVALEPNPASRSDETTHPHVQSNSLCAGDASAPIASALRQGRICDAFVLIDRVLQTYNPSSPYVSLDGWNGVACADCDGSTGRDSMYVCDGCENDLCEHCICSCDLCGSSRCRDCLERDPVEDLLLCTACQERCEHCNRIVGKNDRDSDSGLCPGCLEEQTTAEQLEAEATDSEPISLTQETTHEPVPTFSSNFTSTHLTHTEPIAGGAESTAGTAAGQSTSAA